PFFSIGNDILSKIGRCSMNASINEKINGTLEIADIHFTLFNNFPSFSLTLENPVVRDSLYAAHHVELFRADKIILQLELLRLLRGEINLRTITIEHATISLVKMKNGYSNTNIFKKNTSSPKEPGTSSSLTATMNKVFLKDVQFSMVDSTKNKWFKIQLKDIEQVFDITPEAIKAKVKGIVYFGGLAFNAEKGSYLTDKTAKVNLVLDFNIQEKKMDIKASTIEIDKVKFLLRGNFAFNDTAQMHLEIDAPRITVDQANTILTQHIAAKLLAFKFENPLLAAIRIDGKLFPGSKPAVDVFFRTENNILTMKSKTFTEVNTLGWFLNHVDPTLVNDDHNSKVILSRFHANLGGIPLRSKVTITDLITPHLLMNATVNMPMEDLHGIVDTSKFIFNGGSLDVAFNYDGKLVEYVDTVHHLFLASVNGSVNVRNANVTYVPRGFEFENVSTDMVFGDSLLTINQLSLEINKNPVSVTGRVLHFIPFLFVPGQSLFAELIVNAGSIDFDNFTSEKTTKSSAKKSVAKKKTPQKQINQTIDNILSTMEADILLRAEKISSGRFNATKVEGHVLMADDFVKFRDIKMNTSGGTFALSGSVTSLQSAPYNMTISASINNADISSLFYSFNDFNQKTVTHENLKGQITTRADFNAQLKKDYAVQPKSMNGKIIIAIKNGALINLDGLDKISQYAFKNRDFSTIEFAQLKDTIRLKGQQLTMSRMQIQSSVVTLYAEGTYGFAGGTDMSIQIPLSNLKKRDKDYKPTNVSADTKLGPSIFLRARDGSDGKIQISYDPFKDFYKEKEMTGTALEKDAANEPVAGENSGLQQDDSLANKKGKKKEKKKE
ncbi:MAG TPA: AsmA-like C-terminal region-containing protein, partial [Chitinophagales bacterium]|nr:AsmA-like C-terminal region-containing protein [Chitinophagales bacterium]